MPPRAGAHVLRRATLAVFALLIWGSAAQTEPFPAFYDVTDVASNDVLNIRVEPRAGSAIIGAFAADATGIEVVRLDETRRWARVRSGEQMGWASARFLAVVPLQGEGFDLGLSCFGTEPFWALSYTPFAPSVFTTIDGDANAFTMGSPQRAAGRLNTFGLSGPGADADLYGILERRECSDGMSDLEYGLTLNMLIRGQDTVIYSGCCSLGAE